MPNVVSPNQRQMETLSEFREMNDQRHREIGGPDKDDDHKDIREIRRRILDLVHEFADLGKI